MAKSAVAATATAHGIQNARGSDAGETGANARYHEKRIELLVIAAA